MGQVFAPFTKLVEKICFEEHEKRQQLYSKQLPLRKYDVKIYPYMAEYLARIFSKYSYTVLTALESCFAISG